MYCGVASDARGAAAGLRPALVHAAGFAAAPLQREYRAPRAATPLFSHDAFAEARAAADGSRQRHEISVSTLRVTFVKSTFECASTAV